MDVPNGFRRALAALFLIGASACQQANGPSQNSAVNGVLPNAPDLSGVVAAISHESGIAPGGGGSQSEVWIAVSPDTTVGAGVELGNATKIFVEGPDGTIVAGSLASIRLGDPIDVWHDSMVVAAAGFPLQYFATQILVRH